MSGFDEGLAALMDEDFVLRLERVSEQHVKELERLALVKTSHVTEWEAGQEAETRRYGVARHHRDQRDRFALAIVDTTISTEALVSTTAAEAAVYAERLWALTDAIMSARGNPDSLTNEELAACSAPLPESP